MTTGNVNVVLVNPSDNEHVPARPSVTTGNVNVVLEKCRRALQELSDVEIHLAGTFPSTVLVEITEAQNSIMSAMCGLQALKEVDA